MADPTPAAQALARYTDRAATEPDVQDAAARAEAIVAERIGKRIAKVPAGMLEYAVVLVGQAILQRATSQSGFIGLGGEVAPVRVPLDPFTPAAPILAPYLGPGIA